MSATNSYGSKTMAKVKDVLERKGPRVICTSKDALVLVTR